MTWEVIGIAAGVAFGLAGALVAVWTLVLALRRHSSQEGGERVDYHRKRKEFEEQAAIASLEYYDGTLRSANLELSRLRKRLADVEHQQEVDRQEWETAIEAERSARRRDNEECDRKLAASKAEREQQIQELHARIGRLTTS